MDDVQGEGEYTRSGHQSRKGRENITVAGTNRGRGRRIYRGDAVHHRHDDVKAIVAAGPPRRCNRLPHSAGRAPPRLAERVIQKWVNVTPQSPPSRARHAKKGSTWTSPSVSN
eukprot:435418-Prorocentrum_minimum.AAC.1